MQVFHYIISKDIFGDKIIVIPLVLYMVDDQETTSISIKLHGF